MLWIDIRIVRDTEKMAALIRAITLYTDVCLESFESAYKGDPMPSEDTPSHCDKAHVFLIKNYTRTDAASESV